MATETDDALVTAQAQADLQKAQLANEAARIANDSARQKAANDVTDAHIARLKDAATQVTSIPRNTVTVPSAAVFWQAEIASEALNEAMNQLAASVAETVAGVQRIFVTTSPSFEADCVEYSVMLNRLKALTESAPTQPGGVPTGASGFIGGLEGLSEGADAAATVANAILTAFQTDSTATSSTSTVADFDVETAVGGALLALANSPSIVLHSVTTPLPGSPLQQKLSQLVAAANRLPAAPVSAAQGSNSQAPAKGGDPSKPGVEPSGAAAALKTEIDSYVATISAPATGGGPSALVRALLVERAVADDAEWPVDRTENPEQHDDAVGPNIEKAVLVVRSADIANDQVVVQRRIFNPRLVVTSYATLNYALLRDGIVIAAGTVTGSSGYSVVLKRSGISWTRIPRLT